MLRWTCCLCSGQQVLHTLPEGPPVRGMTSLAGKIFLLRPTDRDQVEVYDAITYWLERCLTVPNIRGFTDMASCEHYRCLYIGDNSVECIHRLYVHGVQGTATRWAVNGKPRGLSVNAAHNVLVTCDEVRKIKEFNSHGDLLRELTLPDDVVNPLHVKQTRNREFVVCHCDVNNAVQRVCKIAPDGHQTLQSHGRQRGSGTGRYDGPIHLELDNNGFVLVADMNNRRVTLLSPTLDYVRQVVSRDKLKGRPVRLYLDTERRRLYVADNEKKGDKWTAGRVVVFSV